MRGLLVVNPRATTTSPRVVDVIVHALSNEIDLDVTVTTHKGHGMSLGEMARDGGLDVVVTLGGDGVVNEVVNGMLVDGPGPQVPLLAPVPGGSANVFARSLGLPNDAVEATGLILEQLRSGVTRSIGLGTANDRWFLANAGLGIDAEIIAAMEQHRRAGRSATPARYLSTTLQAYFLRTDRREPALTLTRADPEHAGVERYEGVFFAFVQNTSPWTYFGTFPLNPCPEASFDSGLDVFALRRMRIPTALAAARRMLTGRGSTGDRGGIMSWHDQPGFTLTAQRPVAFQLDGEGVGDRTEVVFTSRPDALRVVC